MVKMRLHGLLEDVERIVENLKHDYNVVDVSKPYKDRKGELVRVYITLKANN